MENWEFLLQKQGDKSWLPLESPTVEILEGQYRLASRTTFVNMLIGIQLSYSPSPANIHKPLQTRLSKRVNSEGLLIVMPYTNFTPGTWQIECIELEKNARDRAPWSVCMRLEVQPISAELASDWPLNLPNLDTQEQASEHSLTLPESDSTSEVDSTVTEPIAQQPDLTLHEFSPLELSVALAVPETQEKQETIDTEIAGSALVTARSVELPYQLVALDRLQYLIHEGQVPVVSGKAYLPGELEVVLKNPQDLETVMQSRFRLEFSRNSTEPIDFSFELPIPVRTSQVMVGEVRLHPSIDVLPEDSEAHIYAQAISLTHQSPDVLAEVAQELTTQTQTIEPLLPPTSDAGGSSPASPADSLPRLPNVKLPQLPLQSSPDRHTREGLETKFTKLAKLPKLPPRDPLSRPQSQPVLDDRDPETLNLADVLDLLSESNRIEVEGQPSVDTQGDTTEIEVQNEMESVSEYEVVDPAESMQLELLPSEEEKESQGILKSLQIGDRFLDKLQALSKESINESLISQQVSEFIEAEVGKLESEIDKTLDLEDLGDEFEQILIADELLVVRDETQEPESRELLVTWEPEAETEVEEQIAAAGLFNLETTDLETAASETETPERSPSVVEPDCQPLLSEQDLAASEALNEVLAASEIINKSTTPSSEVCSTLAANQPVPLPILEIPEGEAIAGMPMPILIELPIVASKLFVKFWVKDCQTRNIIDGPRWLVDFQREYDPDRLTVRTPITLPLGMMEVAFEAVAVEMQTQRESRKTTITRTVAPPNFVRDEDLDFDPP